MVGNGISEPSTARIVDSDPLTLGPDGSALSCADGSINSQKMGMGDLPPLMTGHPYNGYKNPYYWVDEFIPYYMEIIGV